MIFDAPAMTARVRMSFGAIAQQFPFPCATSNTAIGARLAFKLPMICGDKRTLEVNRQEDGTFKAPDKQVGNKCFRVTENTDETVALLSKLDVDKHIDVEIKLDELDLTSAES